MPAEDTDDIVNKYIQDNNLFMTDLVRLGYGVPTEITLYLPVAEDYVVPSLEKRLHESGWDLLEQAYKPGDDGIKLLFNTNGMIPI